MGLQGLSVPVLVMQRELCPANDKKCVPGSLAGCVRVPRDGGVGDVGPFWGALAILGDLDPSLGMDQPVFPPQ